METKKLVRKLLLMAPLRVRGQLSLEYFFNFFVFAEMCIK